jgi:hypothetical protein
MRQAAFIRAAMCLALQGSLGLVAAPVGAQMLSPGSHASGGVSSEGQEEMRATRTLYNLRLTFAEAMTGAYVAGVVVTIQPAGEKTFFGPYIDCGPLFYVRLNPGSYTVNASYRGVTRTRTLHIGTGATEATLYWPLSEESATPAAPALARARAAAH